MVAALTLNPPPVELALLAEWGEGFRVRASMIGTTGMHSISNNQETAISQI